MDRLTAADIAKSRAPVYVDTEYGHQVGVRRMTGAALIKAQAFFSRAEQMPDGTWRDPMGVAFLDADCPACEAAQRRHCEPFADEPVPHEARVSAAQNGRHLRGNRAILSASVVDPVMTVEGLEYLESNPKALESLLQQLMRINGLTKETQVEADQTFREGVQTGVPS